MVETLSHKNVWTDVNAFILNPSNLGNCVPCAVPKELRPLALLFIKEKPFHILKSLFSLLEKDNSKWLLRQ